MSALRSLHLKAVRAALFLGLLLAPGIGLAAVSAASARTSEILLEQGIADVELGRSDEAVAALERAIVANPANARAFSYLGRALQQGGDLKRADKYYRTALTIDPNEPDALNWLGQLDHAEGRAADARAKLDRLTRVCADCPQTRALERVLAAE